MIRRRKIRFKTSGSDVTNLNLTPRPLLVHFTGINFPGHTQSNQSCRIINLKQTNKKQRLGKMLFLFRYHKKLITFMSNSSWEEDSSDSWKPEEAYSSSGS